MSQFNTPLPRAQVRTFNESSPQRSLRDSDSVGTQWQKLQPIKEQLDALVNSQSKDHDLLNKIRRRILGGGSGTSTSTVSGGLNPRGVYVPGVTYGLNDFVKVQTGPAAGSYYSTTANNNNDPATGIGWLQFAPGTTEGAWT